MSSSEAPQPSVNDQLKAALWLPIGTLVDTTLLPLRKNATPQFIGALTEMVWAQIGNAAEDVEAFARHAGRTTVDASDVLLLARKSEGLESILKTTQEEWRPSDDAS